MKLPRPAFFALCLLPLSAFAAFWVLGRVRAAPPPAIPPAGVRGSRLEPIVAERRALQPNPVVAAPAPAPGPGQSERATWVALNNEATTSLAQGDLAGAVLAFERCFAAEPSNAIFAGNLAEALVRLAKAEHERGDLAHAVEHLARAVELASAREDIEVLRAILERWRRELEIDADDWTEDSSRFELAFDSRRSDLLHHSHEVLEHLEQSYDDLVRWFGEDPFPAGSPIRVVLYDHADFDRLTGLGDWAAGVFDGVVRVSVEDLTRGASWRPVLVHELVHAFVQALGGVSVPGWLNEGLAQLLEGRPDAIARLRERLDAATLFPLERLGGSLAGWEDTAAIARAYAESLVFVDYLRQSYGEESLRRMVKGAKRGETPEASFEAWSSVPLALVFQDWQDGLGR